MINVDTVVGKTIQLDNEVSIIPISKIKCSFAAGGTEFEKNKMLEQLPFGGATGGNVNIVPIAFLVIRKDEFKVLHLNDQTHLFENLLNEIPNIFDKLKQMFNKNIQTEEVEFNKNIKL